MKKTLLAVLLCVCAASAARAQNAANLDQVDKNPEKPIQAEKKAAAEASAAVAVSTEDVTFDQVLQAPADVDLNERYALTQIRMGDLRGAATTLERVLLIDPRRYRTRLLYGVVLVRLDDAADAARELDEVLATPDLPPSVREEAQDYRRQTASRLRDTHFDARLTMGIGYDDNRNSAPDGGKNFLFGDLIPLDRPSQRKADGSLQFIGSVGGDRDFGGPEGHSVFARFTYYRAEQQVYNLLNLQVYTPEVGATFRTRWADFTPTLSYDDVLLSQSNYLRSYNEGLRVSRRWNHQLESWFEFGNSDQDFLNTPRVPFATQRTGDQMDWTLGSAWNATPVDRLSLTLLHRRKYAQDVSVAAYRRESIGGEWLHLLGKGRFVSIGLTGVFDRYEIADPTVLPGVVRHDDAAVLEFLYGQPLDLLWKRMKNFTGSIGYERYMENSSVINYQYSNDKVTALITYKWGI